MYNAKSHGKNNVQFFTKEMDVAAQKRTLFEAELRAAVHEKVFTLAYQPIHCSHGGQIAYVEALVRWEHPAKGVISPAQFIPLAEEIGLINQLGDFVLQQACAEAVTWQKVCDNPPGVAVNVSSLQFQQADFVDKVISVLRQTKLAPEKLSIEVTESLLISDDSKVKKQLIKLKEHGIKISLDDFGTGYSSLSYLKRFPIDKLKIDRSFIQDIEPSHCDTRLVRIIYSIAHSLKMELIAEGVETEFQLEQLKQLGSSYIQGYLYSKPLPANELHSYFVAHSEK